MLKFYMFLIQDPNNGIENGPDSGIRMFHRLGFFVEERLDFGKSKSEGEVTVLSLMSSLVPRGGDHQDTTGRPQLHQLRPSLWQARVGWTATLDNLRSVSQSNHETRGNGWDGVEMTWKHLEPR